MSRLVIQGIPDGSGEIILRPGVNRVGRSEENDHPISDPSVSSFHCEIEERAEGVVVHDLGSTNGTFINSVPVRQAIVEPGQTLRLGNVELLLPAPAARVTAAPVRAPVSVTVQPLMSAPAPVAVAVATSAPRPESAPDECRNHPGAAAAYLCQQCGARLCRPCVRVLRVGVREALRCPNCDGFCVDLAQHRRAEAQASATFASVLPSAFRYPFLENGPIILFCATALFGALDFAWKILAKAGMYIGLPLLLTVLMSVGFLFAYLQNVISATVNGKDTPPGFPDISGFWDDVGVPAMRCFAIWLVCGGPGLLAVTFVSPMIGVVVLLAGLFCMPMAILAVTMADSVAALNPLVICSSIAKVIKPYFVACGLLILVTGLVGVFETIMEFTPLLIASSLLVKAVSIYGLTVEMRVLGLLYRTNKQRLGWFE